MVGTLARDMAQVVNNESMPMPDKVTMASYTSTIPSEIFHIFRALLFAKQGPFQTIEAPNLETRLIESGNGISNFFFTKVSCTSPIQLELLLQEKWLLNPFDFLWICLSDFMNVANNYWYHTSSEERC